MTYPFQAYPMSSDAETETIMEVEAPDDLGRVYALRAFGEVRAAAQLAEVGIAAWAPTYKRIRPAPRGKFREVDAALIPGYVFARLKPEDFAAALATERVYGVVSNDGAPVPIPEADWVNVLLMVMSGRFDERAPAKKAVPRAVRHKGLSGLHLWFAQYEAT